MNSRLFVFGLLCFLTIVPVLADAPVLQVSASSTIREQDLARLAVLASDADGDSLTYSWSIASDPTTKAFFLLTDGSRVLSVSQDNQVRVGLASGPSYPNASFTGQAIQVRVDVSDGQSVASHVFDISVDGVNLPPVIRVDETQMGTPSAPRMTGEGVGLNASQSQDPEGGRPKFLWRITSITGGQSCGAGFVLLGKETENPGLIVPLISATRNSPMRITLQYIVEDGLHLLTGTYTGYMASENGCNSNSVPVVSGTADPAHAAYGGTVTLTGAAFDPGDTLSYSWMQLNTTGGNQVALSAPQSPITTFVAPSATTSLNFRFTATDSKGAAASQDVSVQISPAGSGGSGGSSGGGSNPGGSSSGVATGINACSDNGNQAAIATVPAFVTSTGGSNITVSALDARDPDNTEVFVGGQVLRGITYAWEVIDGSDVVSDSNLSGAQTAIVTLATPAVAATTSLTLGLTVSDAASCATRYTVQVQLAASVTNETPRARLKYRLSPSDSLADVPAGAITVSSPLDITLDAGTSTDDGTITYAFALEQNLSAGGAALQRQSDAVRLLKIQSGSKGNLTVRLTTTDDKGLTDTVTAVFAVQNVNKAPVVKLTYRLNGAGQIKDAPATAINIKSPAEITLNATGTTDESAVTYAFSLEQNLSSGGAVLSQSSDTIRQLQIQSGSAGTLTVRLTVTDEENLSTTKNISFSVENPNVAPTASVSVKSRDREVNMSAGVEEGAIVTLDGSGSSLANGTAPGTMAYRWRQLSGVPVNLVGSTAAVARFRAPELEEGDSNLVFELVVSNSGQDSDPVTVSIPLSVAPVFFSQVAFGPVADQAFRTVIVLINSHEQAAEDVTIDFFDQDGFPLAVSLDNQPWNPATSLRIAADSSRRLVFSAQDKQATSVGWARVRSDKGLTGLVLYQLVDGQSEGLNSEVSLFSSARATRFSTFFDKDDGLAAAIANPGDETARFTIMLLGEDGASSPVASQEVSLAPGEQLARFLDASYFGNFPGGFQSGTLVIEASEGDLIVTVLKTKDGLSISTLPLATR